MKEAISWLRAVVLLVGAVPSSASAFGVGDTVRVIANTNARTGPGTSYPEITDSHYPGQAPAGTMGRVLAGPQSANGYTWWRVDFG
jgi:uncharacterized protein YraI